MNAKRIFPIIGGALFYLFLVADVPTVRSSSPTPYNGTTENTLHLSVKLTAPTNNRAIFPEDLGIEINPFTQIDQSEKYSGGSENNTCRLPIGNAKIVGGKLPKILDLYDLKPDGKRVRIRRKGHIYTQDYRSQRLNIFVNEENVVTKVSCG